MDDHPSILSPAVEQAPPPAGRDLLTQALMMVRAFVASPKRTKLFLLGGALVVVIGATAFGQIRLNAWNRPFYDALARKDVAAFLDQLHLIKDPKGRIFRAHRRGTLTHAVVGSGRVSAGQSAAQARH